MLPKNLWFKCEMYPALVHINDQTFVVPGWHIVPNDTTLKEVYRHWIKEEATIIPTFIKITPKKPIREIVISKRTGEKYLVEMNGLTWSCTCVGYGYRNKCKHIDEIKLKYEKNEKY